MAQINASVVTTSGIHDLTALGTADWLFAGTGPSANSNARKNVAPVIVLNRLVGTADNYFDPGLNVSTWSDGPAHAATGSSSTAKYAGLNLSGAGYSFTVPAGTVPRDFNLIVGMYNGPIRVRAILSDGSATLPDIAWTAGGAVDQRFLTFNFAAASEGQSMTVSAYADEAAGAVHFQSAALSIPGGGETVPDEEVIGTDDARVVWSPYNWDDRGDHKSSNTPGAFLDIAFTGPSVSVKVDVSRLVAAGVAAGSYPTVSTVVDGSSVVDTKLTSSMSAITRTGLSNGPHTIRVSFNATDPSVPRFGADPINAVRIAGFTVDPTGSLTQASDLPPDIAFTDSRGEGWASLNIGAPAGNSARHTIWPIIAKALGGNLGLIGFSGIGFQEAGFDVPKIIDSFGLYSTGRSRLVGGLFSPQPRNIFCDLGANGLTYQSDVESLIMALRTAAPNANIFFMVPAGGFARGAITAAVTAKKSTDAKLYLSDLGAEYQKGIDRADGNVQTLYSVDCLHPNMLSNGLVAGGFIKQFQMVLDGAVPPALTQRTVSLTLKMDNPANPTGPKIPAANLQNLGVSFADGTTGALGAFRYESTVETTDASGALTFQCGTTVAPGTGGRVIVEGPAGIHYNGPGTVA